MPRLPRISADEPVGLAVHRERGALDLLVVLELGLEQPHHLDREAGGAGDADRGELVGREDLLDVALGDDVAHRGPAVTGHDHAAGERRRHDRGAVRGEVAGVALRAAARRRRAAGRVPASARKSANEEVPGCRKAAGRRGSPQGSLPALLDERLHEVLGVGLQHVVDLVEDRVDVVVQRFLALGDVALGDAASVDSSASDALRGCFCSWAMPRP